MPFLAYFYLKKQQKQQKWLIRKSFIGNKAKFPEKNSLFGPLKAIKPKLNPFQHFYTPKWKNL